MNKKTLRTFLGIFVFFGAWKGVLVCKYRKQICPSYQASVPILIRLIRRREGNRIGDRSSSDVECNTRPYRVKCTGSPPASEVERRWARSVLHRVDPHQASPPKRRNVRIHPHGPPARSANCAVHICSRQKLGKMTLAGLEPAIFGSEDQRLIH